MDEPTVFVSYARNERFGQLVRQKLDVLLRRSLERRGITLFVDDQILRPGDAITREIVGHAGRAVVGVLLISPGFLASDYIQNIEYPIFVSRAQQGLTQVIPILTEDCLWQHDPFLEAVLFANDVTRPLITIKDDEAGLGRALTTLAHRIVSAAIEAAGQAEPAVAPVVVSTTARTAPEPRPDRNQPLATLHDVPPLPRHMLPRPAEFGLIRETVLGREVNALGLVGQAGIGKSVLASMISHDKAVRAAFPDGIYWLTVGESADPVTAQTTLCVLLGDVPSFRNRRDGREQLLQLLHDKKCLVVLDDVWAGDQLQALLTAGPEAFTLVAARKQFVVETAGIPSHQVAILSADETKKLLSSVAGTPSPQGTSKEVDRVVTATGGVALAVALVGSAMKHGQAWTDVAAHLETDTFGDHPYANAFKAMTLATATMRPEALTRYRRLAVFPADAAIPAQTVEHWWRHLDRLTAEQTRAELKVLADLELIELSGDHAVRLHDLKHDFIQYDLTEPLPMLHGELVDSYAETLQLAGAWGELSADEPYLWDWLAYHTRTAGRFTASFVTDPAYIVKRLWKSGVHAAESDLVTAAQEEHQRASEADRLARLIARVGHLLTGLPTLASAAATFRVWTSTLTTPLDLVSLAPLLPRLGLVPPLPMPGVADAQLRVLEGHRGWILTCAFSPDGQLVATGGADATVRLWHTATGALARTLADGSHAVRALDFAPDGKLLAVVRGDGSVDMWRWDLDRKVAGIPLCFEGTWDVRFAPDGRRLAIVGEEGLRLFELPELTLVAHHAHPARSVAFAPDGEHLAIAGEDGIQLLTVDQFGLVAERQHPTWSVAYSPTGHQLAATGENGIQLLNLPDFCFVAEQAHSAWSVAYSPDGRQVATAGEDGTTKLWNTQTGQPQAVLRGHTDWVRSVRYSAAGNYIATTSDDGTARIWDANASFTPASDDAHDDWVRDVTFSSDGRLLASGSDDGTARLWHVATGSEARTIATRFGHVLSVAISPDDRLLATASSDGNARTWDIGTGETVQMFHGHTDRVRDVAFSKDGRLLATASDDGTARLWDAKHGHQLGVLRHPSARLRAVSFSPDGELVATAGNDTVARIWQTSTGEQTRQLTGHTDRVRDVKISPDGRQVATASDDGTVRLWDLVSGTESVRLRGHTGRVRAVAFDVREQLVFTADSHGIVRLFDRATGEGTVAVRLARSLRALDFSPTSDLLAAGGDNAWFLLEVTHRFT